MDEAVLDNLLHNWARWCRSDPHRLGYPEPPIFKFWLPRGDSRDPGWGDEDAAPESDYPVDIRKAEALDPMLLRLRTRHFRVIRRYYLFSHRCDWQDVGEARRALCDLIPPEVEEALL